ncbi:hypothetical protein HYV82_02590 [Candidatus Woesearchaeota archaeon]|nr:hypothetical protein [Candidatus Woesearchaeota archaeon]
MEIFLYAALGIAGTPHFTPLHEWHAEHARVMHEFAGWDMPGPPQMVASFVQILQSLGISEGSIRYGEFEGY